MVKNKNGVFFCSAHHVNRGSLEVRSELSTKGIDEFNGLLVCDERPARRVQVRAEVGGPSHVGFHLFSVNT